MFLSIIYKGYMYML